MRSKILYLLTIFTIILCNQSSASTKFKPTPETHPHAFFRPISPALANSSIALAFNRSPSQSSTIPLSPPHQQISTPPDRTGEDASPIRPSSQSSSTPASANSPQGYTAYCYHSFDVSSYIKKHCARYYPHVCK